MPAVPVLFALLVLASGPLDVPPWPLDTPQRVQDFVALCLKQRNLSPAQNAEVVAAVAAVLQIPEVQQRYPALSAGRRQALKEELTGEFNLIHERKEYHTALNVQALAASVARDIRVYVLTAATPAPTPEALEQLHALRLLCEERISRLYPGITQFRREWAQLLFQLDYMVKSQASDMVLQYKTALPRDEFEKLVQHIQNIPPITVGRGFSRAYFAMERQRKGLRPPPPDNELYEPGTVRCSWHETDHDLREAWLITFGVADLVRQYTDPIRAAFQRLDPARWNSMSEIDDCGYEVGQLVRRSMIEHNEIAARLSQAGRATLQQPRDRPAPGPPQPAPPGVAAPPLENRSSLILIVAGLAAAAVPLIALYVFGRRNRN